MGYLDSTLYPRLPVWLQNLGLSAYGYCWRHERLGGGFPEYVRAFQERERWPAPRFQEYLVAQLRRVLPHALAQVPHYQRVWAEAGLAEPDLCRFEPADLSRLPVLTKADLRRAPAELLARDAGAGLRSYPSSGTTGTPITVCYTAETHRQWYAAREARSFGWAGASVAEGRAMIGGRLVVPEGLARPPYYRYNRAERQVYFSAYHISPATAPDYVAGFNRYRPRLLTGYACSYYLLARMMLAAGLALEYEPAALVLSSEKLTGEMKEILRRAFRARAFEEYGSVENCALATECECGRLHVSPDFGLVEIVDDAGRPVPPGVEGRILCTGLLNAAQPLIRYEIGDLGAWSPEPCPCGRSTLPVLQEIVGRLEDVVTGPDGRQLVRFHGIFVGLPNVLEGQVVQEELDRFTVRLVTTAAFGAGEAEIIRRRFAQRLGPVRVAVEQVPEIPRTRRGKFRAVISRLGMPPAE